MSVPQNITHATKRYSIRTIRIADPAAGADFSVSVPAGMQWRLRSIKTQFVTSATVATRQPVIQFKDDAGNVVAQMPVGGSQAATNTQQLCWGVGLAAYAATGTLTGPLVRDMVLGDSYTIASSTLNIQAADQYSGIWLQIEESSALS